MISEKVKLAAFWIIMVIPVIALAIKWSHDANELAEKGEVRANVWVPATKNYEVVVNDPKAWIEKTKEQPVVSHELFVETYRREFGDQPGQLVHLTPREAFYRCNQGKIAVNASEKIRNAPFGVEIKDFRYLGDGIVSYDVDTSFISYVGILGCALVGGVFVDIGLLVIAFFLWVLWRVLCMIGAIAFLSLLKTKQTPD